MVLMIINFLFSNAVFAASESLNCDQNKNAYPWCEAGKEGFGGSAGLVARFYEIALAAVGVAAFGAMVYGGILYTVSAGNPSKQQDAIGWLTSAALGIVLLLGAYLLLYTINPKLTSLTPPEVGRVELKENEIKCVDTEYIKCVKTPEGKTEGVLNYSTICNGYTFSGKNTCESQKNCAWVLKEASPEIQKSPGWAESNGSCQAK